MPTDIKVIIEDNAMPVVQARLDDLNDFLRRATQPQLTLDEFINKTVVDTFGISQEAIAERDRQAQRNAIVSKIDSVKVDTLKAIATAVDEALGKIADPIAEKP
jgi:hypothetical protein